MSLIELKNITFSYDESEKPVFEHFSLDVEKGSCLAVKGDNGSGKTTLFRILNGLSFPQEGKYLFDDTEINEKYLKNNKNSKLFHKSIGYLFQNTDIMLFNPKVYDEIAFGPRQMGLSEKEVDERVKDCLKMFDIDNLSDKAPYHLSGGQKKKVALAAVLSLNPDVLILDEPFAGLDKTTQEHLTAILLEMKKAEKTIIISTHSDNLIDALADTTLEL